MTSEELAIILTARFDQVDQAMSAVESRINQYASNAAKTGEKVQDSFDVGSAAIAAAGVELVLFTEHATEAAVNIQLMNVGLNAMAKASGISEEAVDGTVEALEKIGFTTEESQDGVSRLMRAEISLADGTKLATVAEDLAVASNKDHKEVLDALIQSVAMHQTRMLRQIGISVDAAKAERDYAANLGTTSEHLTEAEKRQAILNAIMEKGTRVSGAWAAGMADGSLKVRMIGDEMSQAAMFIGQTFAPALISVTSIVFDMVKAFNDSSPVLKIAVGLIVGVAAAYIATVGVLRLVLVYLPQVMTAFSSVNATLLANPWAIWAAAATVAIVGTMALLSSMEKQVNQTNSRITAGLHGLGGAPITTASVEAQATAAEKLARALQMAQQAEAGIFEVRLRQEQRLGTKSNSQTAGLTPVDQGTLQHYEAQKSAADSLVEKYKQEAAAEKGVGNAEEALLKIQRERFDYVLQGTEKEIAGINKKRDAMVRDAQDSISNEKVKAEIILEINQTADLQILEAKRNINATDLGEQKMFLLKLKSDKEAYAKDQIAIDRSLAAIELQIERQSEKDRTAATREFFQTYASEFASQVNIFHQNAIDMDKIFGDMINNMVTKVIESGIMDLVANILAPGSGGAAAGGGSLISKVPLVGSLIDGGDPGSGGGLFGGGGFLGLGFDDPIHDAMAKSAGSSKWFADMARNFSDGYVNSALVSARSMTPMIAGAGGQTVQHFDFSSQNNFDSIQNSRRAAFKLGNKLKGRGII